MRLVSESLNEFVDNNSIENQIIQIAQETLDLANNKNGTDEYNEFLEGVAEDLEFDGYIPEDIHEDLMDTVNPYYSPEDGIIRSDFIEKLISGIKMADDDPEEILPEVLDYYSAYLNALSQI